MRRDIERLKAGGFDFLVIGGGINGAAIANMASLDGHTVALIEKSDFASGTSSKSTKLIHGGIRYLEQFDFGLVKESLRERHAQLGIAPHLVRALPFLIPVYKSDPRPLWMMKLGVWLYDKLTGTYTLGRREFLTPEEVLRRETLLVAEGLCGGVVYYDAQMDDARLCLENVLQASEQGAVIANYVEARSFIKQSGTTVGVQVKDNLSGETFDIRAKKVLCAAGPWTNAMYQKDNPSADNKLRLTKGVHIVYAEQLTKQALLIQTDRDKRILFIIPWLGQSLIGTTDTDYSGDPDNVAVDEQDVDYLMEAAGRVLPKAGLSRDKIVTTFAGLRPLVPRPGSPSKISRNHAIEVSYTGVVYIKGGKYTTYRKIAEDALKAVWGSCSPKIKTFRVFGGPRPDEPVDAQGATTGPIAHLKQRYGSRYGDVLALTYARPELSERIVPELPAIKAQIIYARDVEMAQTTDDIVQRRLGLHYLLADTTAARAVVEKLV